MNTHHTVTTPLCPCCATAQWYCPTSCWPPARAASPPSRCGSLARCRMKRTSAPWSAPCGCPLPVALAVGSADDARLQLSEVYIAEAVSLWGLYS
jgi:hypothetical protein